MNACCKPEYAIRGMTKSILMSCKRVTIDLNKVTTEEKKLADESCSPVSSLPVLLLKKHIRTAPRVMVPIKTKKSVVVPLVLPPCSNTKLTNRNEKQTRMSS